MSQAAPVYLGTVLLEKNRWGSRQPTLQVSDWVERAAAAGFDGLELWQNHAVLATAAERERLRAGRCPVAIFNSYADCADDQAASRAEATRMVALFAARGMKYNFGRDKARHAEYTANVRAWRGQLPATCRMLCECHGGTSMEEPAVAARTLAELGDGYEAIVHVMGRDEAQVRQWFQSLGARVTHAHVALSSPDPAKRQAMRLAEDPAFVKARIALLRQLGFRGSWTIEFTEGVRGHEDVEKLFANAVDDLRFLRQCLAATGG